MAEPGWEEFLEEWGIRLVLIETSSPLSRALVSADWEIAYQDEQAFVFRKDINNP